MAFSTTQNLRQLPFLCRSVFSQLFRPTLETTFPSSSFFHTSISQPRKLIVGLRKKGGRGRYGHKTVGRQGGGHKQNYRIIDFKRAALQSESTLTEKVLSIQYDPCRSARLALVAGEERKYILAPDGVKPGQILTASREKPEKMMLHPGNAYLLRHIPLGQSVHNIELRPGKGGQIVRSAGTSAIVHQKTDDQVKLKLPSGAAKWVKQDCVATIGRVSNVEHRHRVIGKAGRSRWLGIRPKPNKQKKLRKKKEGV
eukprot:m.311344 g.311344  ORF g.311344 m.311344 type:complete len:255 (+) comp66185_c0_seq1:47-811(+)